MKINKFIIYIHILLFGNTSWAQDKAIIGDYSPDWVDINFLEKSGMEYLNSRSVGHLKKKDGRCIGFLISQNIILTNYHCVEDVDLAKTVKINFNFQKKRKKQETFECPHLLGNNQDLDYSLIGCKGRPGEKYGFLKLSQNEGLPHDNIYVIHHNCDFKTEKKCFPNKVISRGQIVDHPRYQRGYWLNHTADTLGGSSGSPILDAQTNKVIGIHSKGHYKKDSKPSGRGIVNSAFKMNLILQDIKERFPQILGELEYN